MCSHELSLLQILNINVKFTIVYRSKPATSIRYSVCNVAVSKTRFGSTEQFVCKRSLMHRSMRCSFFAYRFCVNKRFFSHTGRVIANIYSYQK